MLCSAGPSPSIFSKSWSPVTLPQSTIGRNSVIRHRRRCSTSQSEAVRNTSSSGEIFRLGTKLSVNSRGAFEDPAPGVPESHQRADSLGPQHDDVFLSDRSVTWSSLGLSAEVSAAFRRANLLQPSHVQAASIPVMLGGEDVVIAAEIGSGKTHAYLAPLFERAFRKRREAEDVEKQLADSAAPIPQSFSLVLCPNEILSQQVIDMANMLQSDLLSVTLICVGQGWPLRHPDVVVATPGAILDLFAFDPKHRQAFVRDVSCVVFDEADMLLGGGGQVVRLINMFRLEEQRLAKFSSLGSTTNIQDNTQSWREFKVEEDDGGNLDAAEDGELDDNKDEGSLFEEQDYHRSKQYIFVAGTLPNVIVQSPPGNVKRKHPLAKISKRGERSPGALLQLLFPAAKTVNGNLLHFHNPRIEHRWVEVSHDTIAQALLEAISGGHDVAGNQGDTTTRTMVFANSVDVVDAISMVLKKVGIDSLIYHAGLTLEKRTEVLKTFQHEDVVLVCTDAAARGIDIPNIRHVVQAEFAKTAVDFLHRVGRTGRAGQSGLVTNLFTHARSRLVEALRSALIKGESVEDAFYPKRSVRKMEGALSFKQRGMMRAKDTS